MSSEEQIWSFLFEETSSSLQTGDTPLPLSGRPQNKSFHAADYVIFAAVLAVSLGIGVFFAVTGGRQSTTGEYLMGGRRLRVLPVAASMFMSYVSAILLLGTAAEVFRHGVQYWWSSWGSVIAAALSAHLFVPMFYRLKLVSSFEYLELRFRKAVKRLGTLLSIITQTFYSGVAMYSPATALEATTGFPAWLTIIITGIVVNIYTTMGGMKAVVWTDTFQGFFYLLGVLLVLGLGMNKAGGISEVFKIAQKHGRLNFITKDSFNPDPTIRLTLWSMIFGRTFTSLYFATGQTTVQRYSALPSERKAFISVILNIPFYILMYILAYLIGLIVFAYYTKIGCDPLRSGKIRSSNQLLPYFVVDALDSPGVPGLFISVLFCGTLSSVSSSLNSLSAITWKDFLEERFSHLSEFKKAVVTKILVCVYGVLAILIAFIVQNLRGHVMMVTQSFISSIGGPLTAIFILGSFFPCANSLGVIVGTIIGVAFGMWMAIGSNLQYYHMTYLPTVVANCSVNATIKAIPTNPPNVFPLYKLSFMLYAVFALLTAIVVGFLVSVLTGGTKQKKPEARLMVPLADKFCCCLSRRCRQPCYCGVDYDALTKEEDPFDRKEEKLDPSSSDRPARKVNLGYTDPDTASDVQYRYVDASRLVHVDKTKRLSDGVLNQTFESSYL